MAGNERGPQHEESDVDVWAIGRFVVAMVAVMAIALGALFGLFRYFESATGGEKPAAWERVNPGKRPPEPRLEEKPVEDLRAFLQAEDRKLNGYGWVDREHGVARIPIARAMELLAQRGLPARREPAGGPLAGELK